MSHDGQRSGAAQRTTMKIVRGAGQAEELSLDVAAQHHGTVEDVLRRLVAEGHIRDQGLLDMLGDPSTVYEQFRTRDGDSTEEPVSPDQDWSELVNKAKEEASELGVARAHRGGSRP